MLKNNIYVFTGMQKRVNELEELDAEQELIIQSQFNQIIENTNHIMVMKKSINSLFEDKSVKENLSTKAVSLGINLLLKKY